MACMQSYYKVIVCIKNKIVDFIGIWRQIQLGNGILYYFTYKITLVCCCIIVILIILYHIGVDVL